MVAFVQCRTVQMVAFARCVVQSKWLLSCNVVQSKWLLSHDVSYSPNGCFCIIIVHIPCKRKHSQGMGLKTAKTPEKTKI